ncbi:MAG: PEGA domain-containing protein [Patescibacteria group bacterium]
MYRPPLFRRVLPWFFVAAFFIAAPVLVYYTAGYRYNTKKGQLERNGTLIIDTTPTSATVILDGNRMDETTPVTMQNVAPGWHTIALELEGYHSWTKQLEIKPERVTFANNIWLWQKEQTPVLALEGTVTHLTSNPARDRLLLTEETPTGTTLAFWTGTGARLGSQAFTRFQTNDPFIPRWQQDGRAVLLNGLANQEAGWWLNARSSTPVLMGLSGLSSHWDGTELFGTDERNSYRLNPRTEAFTQIQLEEHVVDASSGATLEQADNKSELIFVDHSFLTKRFALPNGTWRFADIQSPYVLLTDHGRWMAVNPKESPASQGILLGDYPRWLEDAREPQALFVNASELWQWNMAEKPTLLLRQSEPIIQARWHRSGTTVFFATAQTLIALDLDDRNGRQTTDLATFDRIFDFDLLDNDLYIAGEKEGKRGIWRMIVE